MTTDSYGVLEQFVCNTDIDACAEELALLGHTVFDPNFSKEKIQSIRGEFESTHDKYIQLYGERFLREIDEIEVIRLPLSLAEQFLELALEPKVQTLIERVIGDNYVLNQQNGIINPSGSQKYSQGKWHRDLPYQHFVSSRLLALNFLYCVDDFTIQNGATRILPGTHKSEKFPSNRYIRKHEIVITAKAGSFIVLDCMLYHAGSVNKTNKPRRAINHVYSIPLLKQQISITPNDVCKIDLSEREKRILGLTYNNHYSVDSYLKFKKIKSNQNPSP